jgi:hypothetical protein
MTQNPLSNHFLAIRKPLWIDARKRSVIHVSVDSQQKINESFFKTIT